MGEKGEGVGEKGEPVGENGEGVGEKGEELVHCITFSPRSRVDHLLHSDDVCG